MLPLGKNSGGQAMVKYLLSHGHITTNGKILFFTWFDAKHLLLNF